MGSGKVVMQRERLHTARSSGLRLRATNASLAVYMRKAHGVREHRCFSHGWTATSWRLETDVNSRRLFGGPRLRADWGNPLSKGSKMEKSVYTKGMFVVLNGDRFPVGTRLQRTVARQEMTEHNIAVATVYASHRDGARVWAAPVAWNGDHDFRSTEVG